MTACHLKEEALDWWTIVIEENAEEEITWAEFSARFESRFISKAKVSLWLEKFIQLRQGDSTLKKCINKFTELVKFGLSLINTHTKKAMNFLKCLNSPLMELHLTQIPTCATYEMIIEMALLQTISTEGKEKEG